MLRKIVFAAILLALVLSIGNIAVQAQPPIPDPPTDGGYVLDTLGWLSADQINQINIKLQKLEQDTTVEIAVVTLNDCGDDHQAFRNALFRSWGIGQKESNNGLLLLVCWCDGDKDSRTFEQEVGYGLEGDVPDLLTSKIAKKYFVAKYPEGPDVALMATIDAYDLHLRGQELDFPEPESAEDISLGTLFAILAVVVVLFILVILLCAWLGIDLSSSGGSGYSGSSSDSGSDSSSGGSDFGGGSSGGGGSSTGF